ncbi:MAG: L,D-transpeptidase family protein [Prevotella sp.]|nr:L,D-transpeptidase family protein [Prevotella sp.]
MLHRKGGQSGSQGICSIAVILLTTACLLMVSCFEGNRELSEAEKSAFSNYVDSLDVDLKGLWFDRMGVSQDADSLLSFLRRELPHNGLDTTAFFIPQIAEDLNIVHKLAFDSLGVNINEVLKRLDDNLTEAYVSYATGQRYGFIRPDKLLNRLNMKADDSGYARLFDYDIEAPDETEARNKISSSDRLGYLVESTPKNHIYRILQTKLSTTSDKAFRQKLAVNMERCRWKINHPGENERMILVNIAAQQLWAVCTDSVLNMKICCGATTTKTPLLSSTINYIQVNPEWIIPGNIIKTDVARHAGDSAYFARNNYYIIERSSGDTLNPVKVSSDALKSGRLRVGQRGGAGNSLGRIVFRFPNNFSVYLHDTNNCGAFSRERRTLSHGCVRVQNPFELACFLLPDLDEWALDKLRISMDIKPETERGLIYISEHADDPRPFRLSTYHDVSPRVPVYIIYYTTYPNPETGIIDSYPDIYGYDTVIVDEMNTLMK